MSPPHSPHIYVLAGVNGAGKSSIGGAAFRAAGADYYNPDEAARTWMAANPALTQADANSAAWRKGVELLTRAIGERKNFAFETTLGANTIPRLLMEPPYKVSNFTCGTWAFSAPSFISSAYEREFDGAATTSPPSISGGAMNIAA